MARTRKDVRRLGLVVLGVAGVHLLIGGLFMLTRAPVRRAIDTPVAEVWILPPLARRPALPAERAPHGVNTAIRRHVAPANASVEGHDLGLAQARTSGGGSMDGDMAVREKLGDALRHGQACRKAMMDGTRLPPDCPERGYASAGALPVKPGRQPYWEAQIAANEAARRYKSDPGNVDYWKRVDGPDSPRYTPPDLPAPGVYSTEKAQVMHDVDARTQALGQEKSTLPGKRALEKRPQGGGVIGSGGYC